MSTQFYNTVFYPSARSLSPFHKSHMSVVLSLPENVTQVMLRLKKVQLVKAHEGFLSGKNEIFFISSVTDGLSSAPIKVNESDPWKNVSEGGYLDIIDPGVILYLSQPGELPPFIDWRFLVMEEDSDQRQKGELLDSLSSNSGFSGIQQAIVSVIGGGMLGTAINLADEAFQLIGSILKLNQDDFIGKGAVTYTKAFDHYGIPVGQTSVILPNENSLLQIGDCRIQYELVLSVD